MGSHHSTEYHEDEDTARNLADAMDEWPLLHFAKDGRLEAMMEDIEDSMDLPVEERWHPATTLLAAENGHLDCLKYAHENGAPWHPKAATAAAVNGHLDCVAYAHENGAPWLPETTVLAPKGECRKYAFQHGAPLPDETKVEAWRRRCTSGACRGCKLVHKKRCLLALVVCKELPVDVVRLIFDHIPPPCTPPSV